MGVNSSFVEKNRNMYIIELIVKLIKEKNEKKEKKILVADEGDYESCEHIFLPIDSTGKTLACSKCGFLVKAGDIKTKPRNPF